MNTTEKETFISDRKASVLDAHRLSGLFEAVCRFHEKDADARAQALGNLSLVSGDEVVVGRLLSDQTSWPEYGLI